MLLIRAFLLALLGLQVVSASGDDAPARTSNERSVKISVTPLNFATAAETLDFRVVMDTHSVDLNYDLTKVAVLRDDSGKEYRPASWQGPSGGHHVAGVLRFTQGREIMRTRPGYLELHIDGVAGVPRRSFRWESKTFKYTEAP